MTDKAKPSVVKWPTDEEAMIALEVYIRALGGVAYSWNYLLGKLGHLFVPISGMTPSIGEAVWYSTDSDRTQILMLKAALLATPDGRWKPRLPKAKDDLIWLADRAISLAEARNNAVHAPTLVTADEQGPHMAASFGVKHRRALNLKGKDVLVEFDWFTRWCNRLIRFAKQAQESLKYERIPWPDKPEKPIRKPRKDLLTPRPPGQIE
jgi:hypothetical protein